jgi:phosphatidylglycerophosphate synthase
MNLHRIEGHAEWVDVPAARRNAWQRMAARTSGVITIGNFISVLGLASVPYGLLLVVHEHRYLLGLGILIAGRLCDLLDGWLADKTGTKSPLGEMIDATFDKLSIGLTVIILAAAGILPLWVLLLLVLPHIFVAILALLAWRRGQGLHPSRSGKNSMAVAWVSLVAYVFTHFYSGFSHYAADALTGLLVGLSFGLGAMATVGYIQEFRKIIKS